MNTNQNTQRVLCFGDSNTWGYISATKHQRYSSTERWTGVLQQELGESYEIIEEGLNSRTFCTNDPRPGKEGRDGLTYLTPCLDTHDPLNAIVLMLGSNELKKDYALEASDIASMLDQMVATILTRPTQTGCGTPKLIIVAPPLINTSAEHCRSEYNYPGALEKSQALAPLYHEVATKHGCIFVNAGSHTEAGADGVHITQESHLRLGRELAKSVEAALL